MLRLLGLCLILLSVVACGAKSKEELFALGMKKKGEGAHDAAVVYFKNALEKDASYLEARYQLAKSYVSIGKYENAEKELQKVASQNPSYKEARLDLARTYTRTNKAKEALKEVEPLLRLNPDDADALEVLGTVYSMQEDYTAAEKVLQKVVKLVPEKTQPRLELAAVFIKQQRDREGRQLLEDIIAAEPNNSRPLYMLASLESRRGRIEKALEIYKRITRIYPNDAQAVYKTGTIYLGKGDLIRAEALADDLINRMPKRGEGYQLKGLVQYRKKDYLNSISSLQNAVRFSPNLEGHYYLGLSLYSKGELENALAQFRKISEVAPSFFVARLMISLILLQQKHTDDAIAEIRKVLEVDDHNALAHNILGSALIAKGLTEEGMRELTRATVLDPSIVDAHLKKGLFKLSKGNVTEAEADLSAAVKVSPEQLDSRMLLASFYLRQRKPDRARSLLLEGVKGEREDALIFNALAGIALSELKKDEAIKLLIKAKQTNPSLAAAYYNLALIYASQGAIEKAKAEYQSLLQSNSVDVHALIGLAVLAEISGNDIESHGYFKKANDTKELSGIFALASYHVKKKEWRNALNVVDAGLITLPGNQQLQELKGRMLVSSGKINEAIKIFDHIEQVNKEKGVILKTAAYISVKNFRIAEEQAKRLIQYQPRSAGGYLLLASVYESQNKIDQAIREVLNGLKVDANNLESQLKLGNLYVTSKRPELAMASYKAAVSKKHDYIPAIFAQGALLELIGKKHAAIQKYRDVLAINSHFVPALNNLAYMYASGFGSKDEALRMAINAYKLDPSNAAILDTLGYALLVNGKNDDALKILIRAVNILGTNPTVNYHLAMAYNKNDMKVDARKCLQTALTGQDFPEKSSAIKLQAELR